MRGVLGTLFCPSVERFQFRFGFRAWRKSHQSPACTIKRDATPIADFPGGWNKNRFLYITTFPGGITHICGLKRGWSPPGLREDSRWCERHLQNQRLDSACVQPRRLIYLPRGSRKLGEERVIDNFLEHTMSLGKDLLLLQFTEAVFLIIYNP